MLSCSFVSSQFTRGTVIFKKNPGCKEWSREFHFHYTFFLQIVYWRRQTALAGNPAPEAGKYRPACQALTCMFRQRQWWLQHHPHPHVSEETISHPWLLFAFVLFFCLIGTQKENWKFNLPAVDCSLWCSAVLVSSCDRVRSHIVVFIVAIPPKLNINSSKWQKADQSQTDGRLVVKKIFHGKTQSAVEGNTSANRWITSCIWRPFCWQSQLSALQQMSIGQ